GELDLEPAIERYKEGVALLKDCSKVLSGYRKQVEELTAAEDGDENVPYEGDPDVGADGDLR
ncbi:MAG: exodeoxyribonuclease VII small subunit, partial [Planctomycetota bacterium]